MIKVTLICLAKLKEKYLKDAVQEYQKRLSRYCSLDIIELEPVRLPEKPSQTEIDQALLKEADMILKKIPQNSEIYTLCIEGKELSSEQSPRAKGSRRWFRAPRAYCRSGGPGQYI